MISKVPGRLLQQLERRGARVPSLPGVRRQCPARKLPWQGFLRRAGGLACATAMRHQAGKPKASQQQNDDQSNPRHTRHGILTTEIRPAPFLRGKERNRALTPDATTVSSDGDPCSTKKRRRPTAMSKKPGESQSRFVS